MSKAYKFIYVGASTENTLGQCFVKAERYRMHFSAWHTGYFLQSRMQKGKNILTTFEIFL